MNAQRWYKLLDFALHVLGGMEGDCFFWHGTAVAIEESGRVRDFRNARESG